MNRSKYRAYSVTSFVIVIALWCGLTFTRTLEPMYLPSPTSVLHALYEMLRNGTLGISVWYSMRRVMVGWAIAAVAAIPIGAICANAPRIKATLQPFMEFFRYLPVTALVPLTIIYCGIGEGQKYTIIFLGTFFQLVLMVQDSVAGVDRNLIHAAQTLGTKGNSLYWKVLLPAALPGIMDALRMTIGWAWTYLVVAEMIAAENGLGYMILKAQRFVNTEQVFAGLVMIGVIGLLTDFVMRIITKWVVPWYERLGE